MWILKTKSRSFSKAISTLNSVNHFSSPILTITFLSLFNILVSSLCVCPGRVNSRPLKGSIVLINPRTHDRLKSTVSLSSCFQSHSFRLPVSPLSSEESQKFHSFQGSSWSSDVATSGMCAATCAVLPSSDVAWGWHIAGAVPRGGTGYWCFNKSKPCVSKPMFKSHSLHPALVGSAASENVCY